MSALSIAYRLFCMSAEDQKVVLFAYQSELSLNLRNLLYLSRPAKAVLTIFQKKGTSDDKNWYYFFHRKEDPEYYFTIFFFFGRGGEEALCSKMKVKTRFWVHNFPLSTVLVGRFFPKMVEFPLVCGRYHPCLIKISSKLRPVSKDLTHQYTIPLHKYVLC